jgi:hypothetical protein
VTDTTSPPARERPIDSDPVAKELYETWLAPNGIDEWLPEHATFTVEGDLCTYTRFSRHNCVHPRDGWSRDGFIVRGDLDPNLDGPEALLPVTHQRVVKLERPVTDRVRGLFAWTALTLIERDPEEVNG